MDPLDLDPAHPPPPIIERAYELAASGLFATVAEICDRLISEGYDQVFLHFESRAAIRADLLRLCRESQQPVRSVLKVSSSNEPASKKPAGVSRRSDARRFELKAAECRQFADNAQYDDTRRVFERLATTYDRLAA